MTSTLARFALSAVVATSVVTGTVVAGTGTSAAAATNFSLFCYNSLAKSNPTRVNFVGRVEPYDIGYNALKGFVYSGVGVLQTWTGTYYKNVVQVAQLNRYGVQDDGATPDPNFACSVLAAEANSPSYVYGAFA